MGKNTENSKRFATNLKRSFRKLKYLDKTQSSYFVVTCFIAAFFMFTGVTYSYFTFSKNLNAATITIAKLNYMLESPTEGYRDRTITVSPGETKFVDLNLKSLNSGRTKYALNYKSSTDKVNVYYSETLRKNTSGIIGATGSVIDMRIVIENYGDEEAMIDFDVAGGYLQNILKSNITTGYFEQDLTIRPHLYDSNFENSSQVFNFPDKEDYSFYQVECSNGVTGSFDTENWILNRSDTSKQTSCDVYFKEATDEAEVFYRILGNNETSRWITTKPDNNGLYRYKNVTCTNVSDYSFDENTFDFKINSYEKNALCVINFETDVTIENSNRYTVYFDAQGGKVKTTSKVALKGGKYGYLPKPAYAEHIFLGWFTTADGGEEVKSSTDVLIESDIKLYAHWSEASSVDVTLKALNKTVGTDVISSTDDYGISYYYPSTSMNNYVKYADLYWRIARINGDGSLRLVYDGKELHENGASSKDRIIDTTEWNKNNANDNKYVGYMYGYENGVASTNKAQATSNSTDTNIKSVLENWYKKTIVDRGFQTNISDEIFCNDRTTRDEAGFASVATTYGAANRLLAADGSLSYNRAPQFACIYKGDAFTVRDTERGNASLNYPVGLLTMDEITLIGGTGEISYLSRGVPFWTSTPSRFDSSAKMFIAGGTDLEATVSSKNGVVPVINLSSEFASLLEGTGTKDSPHFVR